MRKFCNILSIFAISLLILLTGCSNESKYYFKFVNSEIIINLNDEIDITTLKIDTNLNNYEFVEILSTDDSLIKINNTIIKGIVEGVCKITIKIKAENSEYTASFNLVINNNISVLENNEESLEYSYDIIKVSKHESVLKLKILKEGSAYSNYAVTLNFENKNKLIYARKISCYYEVKFHSNSQFSLNIKDLCNNEEFVIEINKDVKTFD